MKPGRALITGITGQDGAWLAASLLERGWRVYGAIRQSARPPHRLDRLGITEQIEHVLLDVSEASNLIRAVDRVQPDLVFHLAAPSFVGVSFDQPTYTLDVIAGGTARLLDAIRVAQPQARVYHASTSEMYGATGRAETLSEDSAFRPQSPYAIAKCAAHRLVALEREAYGRFAVNGILFNHESPLRGPEFVTRRISLAAAAIARGREAPLTLGNLDARRDWGWAPEYVDAMFRLLTHDTAHDTVIATGIDASVRDFATAAFEAAGIQLEWVGDGVNERAHDSKTGRVCVRLDPTRYRPADVAVLRGDASRAHTRLGWRASVTWRAIAERMTRADLEAR